MKYFVTFVIVPLLTSCVFMAKPLPTSTLPSVMAKQTETSVTTSITPSVTNPFAVPKAINTPHIIPTKIGQITSQESFRLYDERVKAFENTLQFDIKVSDAKINKFEKHSRYLISAEGKLTNIANHPIVVRRNLSTGFTGNEDIRWDFFLGNTELGYFICCVD